MALLGAKSTQASRQHEARALEAGACWKAVDSTEQPPRKTVRKWDSLVSESSSMPRLRHPVAPFPLTFRSRRSRPLAPLTACRRIGSAAADAFPFVIPAESGNLVLVRYFRSPRIL
jgi:hypothetical protein